MTLEELNAHALRIIRAKLPGVARPKFTLSNPDCCDECREHEQTMAGNTLESLTINHVGNPGWNPTCFMSAHGFRYWFPALVRIASEQPDTGYWEDLFGFHLRAESNRQGAFTVREQEVILEVFDAIVAHENWILPDVLKANAHAWRERLAEQGRR